MRKTSGWVEPGVGSALFMLGLSSTVFPCTGLIPSRSIAFWIPEARSVVLTKATGTKAPSSADGAGVTVGVGLGVAVDAAVGVELGVSR